MTKLPQKPAEGLGLQRLPVNRQEVIAQGALLLVTVFAAPGDFPQEVLDRLRALRDRLAPIGVSVTPLPLSW